MEPNSQPSFIPKRQSHRDIVARVKSPTTAFYWIGVVVFVLAILITVWIFVFGRFFLAKQLEEKELLIKKEIEAFDPELTQTLAILKQRIDSGEGLLSRHVSASSVFSLIEKNTVQDIIFNSFIFTANPGEPAKIEVSGESPSYAVLAFQSDVLKKSEFILNVNFFDIDLNDKGRVVFSFTAEISPKVVSYASGLLPVVESSSSVMEPPALNVENTASSTTSTVNSGQAQ